jgi:hypothetical protein
MYKFEKKRKIFAKIGERYTNLYILENFLSRERLVIPSETLFFLVIFGKLYEEFLPAFRCKS